MDARHITPEKELLFEQAVKELEEHARLAFAEKGWRYTKCFNCGNPILEKNWHTPPDCPICHHSRVE